MTHSTSKIDFSLTPRIFKLAIPVIATSQMDNVVGIATIYMVGKLGPTAISTVGISWQIIVVIMVSMMAITTGTFALVAQAIGAGSARDASATTKQAVTLMSLLSVGISLFGIAATPTMLAFLSVPPNVVDLAKPYLQVFFASLVLMALTYTQMTCFHAAGDTVPALIYTLVSQWLIRLPVAYILAFPLGYDTTGLWIALVIFSALQGILTAQKFLKGEWKIRRI